MDPKARNEAFQKLKPVCVELSQVALNFASKKSDAKSVIRSLESLLRILKTIAPALDTTLGDYVFFPLSHVFRQSQALPERTVELALNSLQILLLNSWKQNVGAELAKQLLILLTFIAGGRPVQALSFESSDELKIAAFDCLTCLFKSLSKLESRKTLTDAANVPAVGHAVSVILDAAVDGNSYQLQLRALVTLKALLTCIEDREVLVGIFPGIISALTKVLQTTTQSKRFYRVLESALQVFSKTLKAVFADSLLKVPASEPALPKKQVLDKESDTRSSWLKATSPQVKLALANVVKLRNHEKETVRHALEQLCMVVLEDCRQSLAETTELMVETLIVLSGQGEDESGLKRLAMMDHKIVESVQSAMHTWVTALPRLMHSKNDDVKRRVITQLSTSFRLLSELGEQSNIIEDTLSTSLRNSVTAALQGPSKQQLVQQTPELALEDMALSNRPMAVMRFQPVLMSHKSQEGTVQNLIQLLQQLAESDHSFVIARELLGHMHNASGGDLMACMWLSLNLLRNAANQDQAIEALTYGGSFSTALQIQLAEELYASALKILSRSMEDEQEDWRLQGLALEAVAFEAQQIGKEFREELVDALYPLVHLIGSPNELLRNNAMTALNVTAEACGYNNVSDLIVENVDYLVNAISLKMNTFDISPQAPKVLLMMIKLTGRSLLPYLDDLVGSIFAALDSFHGYPQLVTLLFSVLGGIVEEGSKSDTLLIESGAEINHRKMPFQSRTIQDLARMLQDSKQKTFAPLEVNEPLNFPKAPWKDVEKSDAESNDDPENLPDAPQEDSQLSKPSINPVYRTVQSIARLGQHYLTHESPVFRRQLLLLTTTACSVLYRNEDEFLPLINDVWPVVMKRLYDPEPFVVVAAAEAIGRISQGAGDFMATRLQNEWGDVKKLYWETWRKIEQERKRGAEGRGRFTPSRQVWDALVDMLVVIMEHVRLDDEMFDDALEMFSDLLEERKDVREALTALNPDAVWVEMWTRYTDGNTTSRVLPQIEGFMFEPFTIGNA